MKIVKLLVSIAICQFAGIIGSIATYPNIAWYETLVKPWFAPPNWVFAPVWLTLYTLMGISLFLVWDKGFNDEDIRFGMRVFGIQLALNILWSFLFFGMRNPALAFTEIIVLWVAIVGTIFIFNKISRTSAFLLLPYILWVSIAALLNYYIWILNV